MLTTYADAGHSLAYRPNEGWNALHEAASVGQTKVVEWLLKRCSADPELVSSLLNARNKVCVVWRCALWAAWGLSVVPFVCLFVCFIWCPWPRLFLCGTNYALLDCCTVPVRRRFCAFTLRATQAVSPSCVPHVTDGLDAAAHGSRAGPVEDCAAACQVWCGHARSDKGGSRACCCCVGGVCGCGRRVVTHTAVHLYLCSAG